MTDNEIITNAITQLQDSYEIQERQKQTILQLVELNQKLAPKAEQFDGFISRDNLKSMKDVSGMLACEIMVDGKPKVISRNDILRILTDTGDVQKTYNGYKCYAKGREHGLVERQTYDVKGNEHYSVLASHEGVSYIFKLVEKINKGVA